VCDKSGGRPGRSFSIPIAILIPIRIPIRTSPFESGLHMYSLPAAPISVSAVLVVSIVLQFGFGLFIFVAPDTFMASYRVPDTALSKSTALQLNMRWWAGSLVSGALFLMPVTIWADSRLKYRVLAAGVLPATIINLALNYYSAQYHRSLPNPDLSGVRFNTCLVLIHLGLIAAALLRPVTAIQMIVEAEREHTLLAARIKNLRAVILSELPESQAKAAAEMFDAADADADAHANTDTVAGAANSKSANSIGDNGKTSPDTTRTQTQNTKQSRKHKKKK